MSDYQDSIRANIDMSQVASVRIETVHVGDASDAAWFKIYLTGRDGLKATINVFGAYDAQGNRGEVKWMFAGTMREIAAAALDAALAA